MIGKFDVTNPNDIDLTLTLTAKLEEWKKIRAALASGTYSTEPPTVTNLTNFIDAAVNKAQLTLYNSEHTKE